MGERVGAGCWARVEPSSCANLMSCVVTCGAAASEQGGGGVQGGVGAWRRGRGRGGGGTAWREANTCGIGVLLASPQNVLKNHMRSLGVSSK